MNFLCPLLAANAFTPPDISPYLIKGKATMDGVTLTIGDLHTWLLLGGGPLLILAALLLVKVMYGRVRFFALEFGEGGFLGRLKAIFHFIVLGTLLLVIGTAATWLGWQALGYSVTMNAAGLVETRRDGMFRYAWEDADQASERIKSTEFWVSFVKDGRSCRVRFQQRHIGESLQDKAISITENALIHSKARRVPD